LCDYAWQTIIARSTMKLELVSLEMARSEVEWLKNLLADIPFGMKPTSYVWMHYDWQLATTITKNKTYNGNKKYI